MKKRIIVTVIVFCFLMMSSIQMTASIFVKDTQIKPILDGNTLYVGGSGPGNYTFIQEAIDDAENGDTVYVYSGEYYEHLNISKTINLVGECKETTFIDDNEQHGTVVFITADDVTVTGFTIGNRQTSMISGRNSGDGIYLSFVEDCEIYDTIIQGNNRFGIYLDSSSNNRIYTNMILDNYVAENIGCGIKISDHSDNNEITNNILSRNWCAMGIDVSCNNNVAENIISDNGCGIGVSVVCFNNDFVDNIIENNKDCGISFYISCLNSTIIGNTISNHNSHRNSVGIKLFCSTNISGHYSTNYTVSENIISNNSIGIYVSTAYDNHITHNNFYENKRDAKTRVDWGYGRNWWDENYWGRSRMLPKPIFGKACIFSIGILRLNIPYVEFDRHPLQEPFVN